MKRRWVAPALVLALVIPWIAAAQSSGTGILPACTTTGDCQLTDFLQGFVNLANWGLAALGLAGVTMFVIGGLYLMLSGGRSSMVSRGKAILASATTGILIVLFAWIAIGTVYVAVTGDSQGTIFAGVTGVSPFSFLKTAGSTGSSQKPVATTCTPTASPGLQVGCSEPPTSTNGPIHVINILLNSKPGCWIGGPIRSTYDSTIATAIQSFQKANSIPTTGNVDPTTWNLLWSENATCVPPTVTDDTGTVIPLTRGGCCIPSDYTVGSCAQAYTSSTGGFAGGLCGSGFTYSNGACGDVSVGNYISCTMPPSGNQKWGTCTYNFTSAFGPSLRTWQTGTLACNALGGTIP